MTDACTAPGSRSTPLVLALTTEPRLRCHSHVDERAAGFFGLGLALQSGRPVAIVSTSGTAAAELTPAVIEAHHAGVPLLILTADRPPELRDVGAGQAIDQLRLYGSATRWFVEADGAGLLGVDRAGAASRWYRTLACRAFWTALDPLPGPVHLNFPLREPLAPPGPLPQPPPGRPDGRPWVARGAVAPAVPTAAPTSPPSTGAPARLTGPGLVVAGRPFGALSAALWRERAEALAELADRVGLPLLADPLSGARQGAAAIAHYDAILREPPSSLAPRFVLRVGDLPTSKPLRSWLADLPATVTQVALDPYWRWQDPDGVLASVLPADPLQALAALPPPSERSFLERWQAADEAAAEAIAATLGDRLSEPRVVAELAELLGPEATLLVASSMPVRDLETFLPARSDGPRMLSNRGANGIDGTVSSAFGVAAADAGAAVLLIGDVALAHDAGALLAAQRLGLSLTIVLLDNGGGGIFDFLPVASSQAAAAAYEQHIATPTGLDFARLAAAYGCRFEAIADLDQLRTAVARELAATDTAILAVRGERAANVELHRSVWAAVRATQ